MYQFFYIRKQSSDPKTATIYKAVFDDRTPISRNSLKETIPVKLWDNKKQRVKETELVNYKRINHILDQHEADFLKANKKASKPTKDCFIQFAKDVLENDYENPATKIKYTTIINSLHQYTTDILKLKCLPIEVLQKIDFIKGYSKWLEQRQYIGRKNDVKKKNKTIFNYISVIKTFVTTFNEQHPELDEIKTVHYKATVGKIEKVESRMLYPDEIDKLINYVPRETIRTYKTGDAKYHFLFQFFTNGLRVSDILLLNYKHFTKGRIEFVVKKNGDKISIPFGYKSCKMLAHFYPQEYIQAIEQNTLGNYELNQIELDEFIVINSKKGLGELNVEDLHALIKYLKEDKTADNSKRITIINAVIKKIEKNVAETMCAIMGAKPRGLVFDYLQDEDFKNIKIIDKRVLTEEQVYKLHRARCAYNSRLKRIAKDIGLEKLTSHVSRHSFAYYMLSSGSKIEEISHAMSHSSIEITQNYINQFPCKFADHAIERFAEGFIL